MTGKFKLTNYTLLILFAAFIWGYSIVNLFSPNREYSEMENRVLKQAPRFSLASLISNDYTREIEEFTNDQFLSRDGWITLKSLSETALGKIENNGIVYGKDHYMFEKRLAIDETQLAKNTDSLLEFAKKFPNKSVTLALVPTSDMILADKLPRGLRNIDQKPVIQSVYDKAGMKPLDLYARLEAYSKMDGNSDQIYYRTDHHWTTAGAFIAYREYAKSLGLESAGWTDLEPVERLGASDEPFRAGNEVPGFYGTYYSKAKLFSAVPDTITWFDIPVKSVTINSDAVDGLYDKEKFEQRDKYAAFLHSNNGVTVIESDCNLNHVDGETSKILVFKDSFGNSFAPFLCYSFDEVTVVDLRYFTGVEKLVTDADYDEILILYSFPTFAQETSIANLKR